MARDRSRRLKKKAEKTLEKVRQAQSESVVDVLRRTQELVERADSLDSVKSELDVEKAKLRDVIGEKARLQQTVGALIAGYDALTNSLGGQIDSMKDLTMFESFVGFFSESQAKQMREQRVQTADIDTQLQDLVVQTQSINGLLTDHLQTLNREYDTVKASLDAQQVELKAQTEKFEATDIKLEELNVQIYELRDSLAELVGAERVAADQELQTLVNEANELTEVRNVALSNAQTHELFAENHKIALDSLLRQKASQRVLIDKLRISTENRIVQYAATVESLRTAAQQESAHTLNEIGTQVDQETSRTMAAIGSAADRQIVEMLERHAQDIQKRRATQADVTRADAEFARRFAEVAQKFIEDTYAEGGPEKLNEHDRIWSDFNLEKNCVHITDENQVRLYLAQTTLALRCLARVVVEGAGCRNLEALAIDALVERLEATFHLLSLRHFYPSTDLPLKLDTTDSGFFHFSVLLDLEVDRKSRESLLRCMPTTRELKEQMAEVLIRRQGSVRSFQRQIARRLYLEALETAPFLEPFVEGPLVALESGANQTPGFWSFATYDRSLNRPFVYLIYFGHDGAGALQPDSAGHQDLRREAKRLASGSDSLLAFSSRLDEALPRLRPRIIKRLILGPYWAPGFTENEGELGALLDEHREDLPFALKWETETLISDRETWVRPSLLSRGNLRQIFWIPRELNLSKRGVSRLERAVLLPHWLAQQLAEADVLPDHSRFVIDKEDQVHGVH